MAASFDDRVDADRARSQRKKVTRRPTSVGRPNPDPTRVAQLAALTFLVGATFLVVGYALS